MEQIIDISDTNLKNKFNESLQREIQSAHLNFLIGSGCSRPAISVLGNIEKEITELKKQGENDKADTKLYNFISPLLDSTKNLVSNELNQDHKNTLNTYSLFLKLIANLIFERKGNVLPKQASIYTTNYDLFIEKASDVANGAYYLNDGFTRNPSLTHNHIFSTPEFFVSRKKQGRHYNYEVEVPSINLIKLHGSFSWSKTENNNIVFSTELPERLEDLSDNSKINDFNTKLSIIFPNKEKFKDTLLNQTYYDLLRIYANELEKENSLLIAIGFSFADEHLLDITQRALRNPTLKLIIICYNKAEAIRLHDVFSSFNNVKCVHNGDEELPFSCFLEIFKTLFTSYSEVEQ